MDDVNTLGQMKNHLSTQEVSDEIGVAKRTILRWIYAGEIPEVTRQAIGGIEVRLWSKADVERARKFKAANYKRKRTNG